MNMTRKLTNMTLFAGSALLVQLAHAEAPKAPPAGIGRAEVLRHDFGDTKNEAIQVRVDFAPGASFPKHVHPGVEIAYVLEGQFEYQLDDRPPVTLKAGDALFIPAGTAHSAKNTGTGTAVELATYIVEKGKPVLVLK